MRFFKDQSESSTCGIALAASSLTIMMHVAEAFRHACMLRALRLLDITESAEAARMQESVTAILDSVAEIPSDSCLIELMVLPLLWRGKICLRQRDLGRRFLDRFLPGG